MKLCSTHLQDAVLSPSSGDVFSHIRRTLWPYCDQQDYIGIITVEKGTLAIRISLYLLQMHQGMAESKEQLKRSIIALLLRLQASDNEIHLHEFAYIHKVATHLGLSADDVLSVETALDDYPLHPPSNEKERMTILYYLLFLMDIDGTVTKEEEQLVEQFGMRLGFRIELTHELIEVVKSYADRELPPDALLNQIKKYLN